MRNKVPFLLILFTMVMSSCKKDDPEEFPQMSLKEGLVLNSSGMYYTFQDDTISKAQSVIVGINAEKQGKTDYLMRLDVYKVYDEESRTLYYSKELTAAERDFYSGDISFITRNQSGKERWTFMITNRNGRFSWIELLLTVE